MTDASSYNLQLFASTAPYYARYRPAYRESMFAILRETFGLDGRGVLLDLGCGTGSLAIPLAPMFERVLAIDPDDAMRAEAESESHASSASPISNGASAAHAT